MPQFLEKKLAAGARSKGLKGSTAKKYVFGAFNNMGAMKGNKETPKGAAMQKKHTRMLHQGFKSVMKATNGRTK
jgi:hypothetical protein